MMVICPMMSKFTRMVPQLKTAQISGIVCLILATTTLAQQPSVNPATDSGEWIYSDITGKSTGGSLAKLNSESVEWRPSKDQKNIALDWSKVEEIRRSSDPAADPLTDSAFGPMILLPDGDRLRGESVALLEKGLAIQSASLGVLNLPSALWSGAIFQPPRQGSEFLRLMTKLRKGALKPGDFVVLSNGDQLQGTVVELDGETLQIQPSGATKPAKLKRAEIIGVGIDPKSSTYPKSTQRLWEIHLSDGSRLSGTGLNLEAVENEKILMFTTRWGAVWQIPISKIQRIRVIDPGQIDLQNRPADAIQSVDYVGLTTAPKFGTNVQGGSLNLGSRYFDRGLGTQSRTLMAYRLNGTEKQFTAWVGVDTSAGPMGQSQAMILIDGKTVYDSGPMKAGEPPRRIQLNLNQAKLLILRSEFGEGGGIRDWVDWCEPTLK